MTSPEARRRAERQLVITTRFLEDVRFWVSADAKVTARLFDLVDAVRRDPTSGIGKPEPLRHLGSGCWSRRITQEHRLVYTVERDRIVFLQARYHY